MAAHTINQTPFPVGATVNVWTRRAAGPVLNTPQVPGQTLVASGVVDATGRVVLDDPDLATGDRYWAVGQDPSGAYRWVAFRVDEAIESGIEDAPHGQARLRKLETLVTDLDSRLPVVESGVAVVREAPVRLKDPDIGGKGDYTTDESAAFSAAIAKAKTAFNGKGEVFIDPGKYKVTSSFAADVSGLRITGAGRLVSVISHEPAANGNLLELGDSGGATRQFIELRDFGILGSATTDNAIFMRDGCVQWTLRDLEIMNCAGTNGAGIGWAGGNDQGYSGRIDRCHLQGNKTGIKPRGKWQWLVIDGCLIYNNTVWGIDAEGEQGGTGGSRLHIRDCEVEQNGLVAGTTGSIRLAGVDNRAMITGLYNEQGTSFPGIAVLLDADGDGIGCNSVRIGGYFGGGTTQPDAIILKKCSDVEIDARFASFTSEPVRYSPASPSDVVRVRERSNLNTQGDDLFVAALDPRLPTADVSTSVITAGDIYLSAFQVKQVQRVSQVRIAVATQAGNVDVGIYDSSGTRLGSTGSTAVGAAGVQTINLTGTVTLRPGRKYWAALVADNAAAAFDHINISVRQASISGTVGVNTRVAAGGLPLPSSVAIGTGQITVAYYVVFS